MQIRRSLQLAFPFLISVAAVALFASLRPAGTALAATCDVPTVAHATIQSAVSDPGCDIVNLTDALYIENVTVTRSLTIQGQGALSTTVDGNANDTVFTVFTGLSVTITDLTITNGEAGYSGGISNSGILELNNIVLSGNMATQNGGGIGNYGRLEVIDSILNGNSASIDGGGIYNLGPLTITNSTLNGNTAGYGGGGIQNEGGAMLVNGSTFSANSAGITNGGGIYNGGGTAQLSGSTFSANSAQSGGGVDNGFGEMRINSSTFRGNSANGSGGGLSNSGELTVTNSIIASSVNGGDCSGSVISLGYNLDSDGSCSLTAIGDLPSTDPVLGPLQDNGGNTFTHALLLSPAIDAGNPATPGSGGSACEATDQRGLPRVGRCDIGAYEHQGVVHKVFLPVKLSAVCLDLYDDFSNPGNGWFVGEDGFVRSEYLNGEYRILTKRSGYFYLYRAPACARENYVVEADARWVGAPGSSYGLLFGLNDDYSSYYLFDMNTDSQQYRLLRRDPGGFVTLVPISGSPAINGGNASNHLKVTHTGSQIILEVNGIVLNSLFDSAISGPALVGLVSSPYSSRPASDARFDNFSVVTLNGAAAASDASSAKAMLRDHGSMQNHAMDPIAGDWLPSSD